MKVSFEVLKWEEHNPRKDIKQMPWFRLKSDIGFSETLYGLGIDAKWLWVFILSLCARRMSGKVSIDSDYVAYHSGVEERRVLEIFQELENQELLIIYPDGFPIEPDRDPIESVRDQDESEHTIKAKKIDQHENGPKKREEERREDKITKDKTRKEETNSEACSSSLLDFINDPVFKDTDLQLILSWQTEYDELYLLEELPKAKAWRSLKQPKKSFGPLFDSWLKKGFETYSKSKESKIKNQNKSRAKEIFESALSYGPGNTSKLYESLSEDEEDALRVFGVSRFFDIRDTDFERRRIVGEFSKCI